MLSVFRMRAGRLALPILALGVVGCSVLVDIAEKSPNGGETPTCSDWPSTAEDFDLCSQGAATEELLMESGGWDVDTDSGELLDGDGILVDIASAIVTMPNGIEALVIMVGSLRMDTSLEVVGSRPLVIASWGDIEIYRDLRVDGKVDTPGPGANPASCGMSAGEMGLDDDGGASAGGGGALGGPGGPGAIGNNNGIPSTPGGAGGVVNPGLIGLQGGCPGGRGGGLGGDGGNGGGAIALVARGRVVIDADIEAVGRGGRGGRNIRSGGGGGGAGGMILLSGNQIEIQSRAALSANGGGGGGGADANDNGRSGRKGNLSLDAASGGNAPLGGGVGGNGSSAFDLAGAIGGDNVAGGGGGGGGAGIITIEVTGAGDATIDSDAIISPPPGNP